MATKCLHNILHDKRIIKKNKESQTKRPFVHANKCCYLFLKFVSLKFHTQITTPQWHSLRRLPFFLVWLASFYRYSSNLRCSCFYNPIKWKNVHMNQKSFLRLDELWPQSLWPISLPLTTADDFHTPGELAQVLMSKGWAGNRYHKQHAMLSVPFRLTYFSTRNSSTQVCASNPVLLFHCSCHHTSDRRRKRGERGRRLRCWRFRWDLYLLVLPSRPITQLFQSASRELWMMDNFHIFKLESHIHYRYQLVRLTPVNGMDACRNTTDVHSFLSYGSMRLYFSDNLWYLYSCSCKKNWVSVQKLMW